MYEWINVTMEAAFAPRDGAGALVFHDKMWLLGGWNPSDKANFPLICTNDVWCSEDGADWVLAKPNTFGTGDFDPQQDWEGRHTAGYVLLDNRMWIVGGDCNQGHYQSDVWCSADGVSWDPVCDPVPWAPRVLHYTAAFDGRIWVMGGQTIPQFAGEAEVFHSDVWSSADGKTWDRVAESSPWAVRGMIGHSAVFKDRIWLLGGGTYDTPKINSRQFYNDVWSTDDGVEWECHTDAAPWLPRQYHDVAVWDGKLWVMEGCYHPKASVSVELARASWNRNDVWFSDDGVNWTELPDTPWEPRHAASPFVYDDALWMVAGNNMESDVWKLVRTT